MRQLMWPSFERAGLPEALLFGIMAKESNGKVHATSRAGAAGRCSSCRPPAAASAWATTAPASIPATTRTRRRMASADYLNERMGELNSSIETGAGRLQRRRRPRAARLPDQFAGRGFWDATSTTSSRRNQGLRADGDRRGVAVPASRSSTAWISRGCDAQPASLRLAEPASIYELTICLGNGGTRDGYMRALRNLNPRYEPDSWMPAGYPAHAHHADRRPVQPLLRQRPARGPGATS